MNVSLRLALVFSAQPVQPEGAGTRKEPVVVEHYYQGLSTSEWQRRVRDWEPNSDSPEMPAILHGYEPSIPVLLDLIWLKDKKIVSRAVDGLVHAVPGGMAAIGNSYIEKGDAVAIGDGQRRKSFSCSRATMGISRCLSYWTVPENSWTGCNVRTIQRPSCERMCSIHRQMTAHALSSGGLR